MSKWVLFVVVWLILTGTNLDWGIHCWVASYGDWPPNASPWWDQLYQMYKTSCAWWKRVIIQCVCMYHVQGGMLPNQPIQTYLFVYWKWIGAVTFSADHLTKRYVMKCNNPEFLWHISITSSTVYSFSSLQLFWFIFTTDLFRLYWWSLSQIAEFKVGSRLAEEKFLCKVEKVGKRMWQLVLNNKKVLLITKK